MDHVTSHRRVVRDETGKSSEIENAVKAENVTHCGDLAETGVNIDGAALLVGIDGTLRRTTMAAIQEWLQVSIQQDVSFNVPYVDEVTKTWMVYDPATEAYKDSGVDATGKVELEGIKGKAGGVASLDAGGKIPVDQIPTPDALGAAKKDHGHTLESLGAAPVEHKHTKDKITDFPTEMKPTAHKSTHATGGTDALTPGDIGAATAGHSHAWNAITGKPRQYFPASHKHSAEDINSGTLGTDRLPIVPAAKGGTGNDSGYIRAGQKAGTTIGEKATAEGANNTASGFASHAEGVDNSASKDRSHAEGSGTTASGAWSHSEGSGTTASGKGSHAEGGSTTASGGRSHSEGSGTTASGEDSHAEGSGTTASGNWSHTEGSGTAAIGERSHAEGSYATANNYASHAGGHYNKAMTSGGSILNTVGDAMVIGNGTGYEGAATLSNCFRVTYAGAVYGLSAFNSSGADYAEFFEWADGNEGGEDRVGYFVTLEGKYIRLAKPGDYILGIVSGQPCIIGNADEDWLGRWQKDEFGRFIKEYLVEEEAEVVTEGLTEEELDALRREPDVREKDGKLYRITAKVVDHVTPSWRYKANPDYDPTQPYVERKDRQEWSCVGMLGVLAVRDDGSCQVNGFCTVADSEIATAAETYIPGQTWRVIERVAPNVVKVVFR